MNQIRTSILNINPNLIQRTAGGWLAIAPETAPVRFGVTGSTQEEAAQNFSR